MIPIEEILKIVAEVHEIEVETMTSKSMKPHLVKARFQAFVILRDNDYTLQLIGKHVGGKNHATVMHGLQKHYDYLTIDKDYRKKFNDIVKKFRPEPPEFTFTNQ